MAVLPVRPALSLDTLVARAKAAQSAPRRPAPQATPRPAPRSLADLERASSLTARDPSAPLYTAPPTPPTALALWITICTCTCGHVTRNAPMYALIKYTENAHSVHYTRSDLDAGHLDLPREIHEKHVRVPFCEACFVTQNCASAGEAGPITVEASSLELVE